MSRYTMKPVAHAPTSRRPTTDHTRGVLGRFMAARRRGSYCRTMPNVFYTCGVRSALDCRGGAKGDKSGGRIDDPAYGTIVATPGATRTVANSPSESTCSVIRLS